jgi:hypothetical protein
VLVLAANAPWQLLRHTPEPLNSNEIFNGCDARGTPRMPSHCKESSGAHSRDPVAPLRKRFAFVAGNDA